MRIDLDAHDQIEVTENEISDAIVSILAHKGTSPWPWMVYGKPNTIWPEQGFSVERDGCKVSITAPAVAHEIVKQRANGAKGRKCKNDIQGQCHRRNDIGKTFRSSAGNDVGP